MIGASGTFHLYVDRAGVWWSCTHWFTGGSSRRRVSDEERAKHEKAGARPWLEEHHAAEALAL